VRSGGKNGGIGTEVASRRSGAGGIAHMCRSVRPLPAIGDGPRLLTVEARCSAQQG